jgi:hypothetical protein
MDFELVYTKIILPSITLIVIVTQVFFAYRIWKNAKEQKELSQKIDKSNKLMIILSEYNNLSNSRKAFWTNLEVAHSEFLKQGKIKTDSLYVLIQKDGFPSNFDPSEMENLMKFIKEQRTKHKDDWGELWELAKYVCNKHHINLSKINVEEFGKARGELTYFWNKWSSLPLDIHEYLMPDWRDLIMLTWLQLSSFFVENMVRVDSEENLDYGTTGSGFLKLAKLAKEEWESFLRFSRR